MKTATTRFGLAVAALGLLAGATGPANASPILTISAQYLGGSTDNTIFVITNTDTTAITNLQLSGLGLTGSSTGLTGSVLLADINGGAHDTFTFTGQASVFTADYDDFHTGEVKYTLTGTYQGQSFSVSFSPSSNDTGSFLGFLGNGPDGLEQDATINTTIVAHVDAPATPEPSTIVSAGMAGLIGLGYGWRRRKSKLVV